MEEVQIVLAEHEQKLEAMEKEISELKAVQAEIRTMNETLVTLANELKHTNEHLNRHEKRLEEMEAIIAALTGGIVSVIIGNLIK